MSDEILYGINIHGERVPLSEADLAQRAIDAAASEAAAAPTVPDNPTLGDWRVGLVLWVRPDPKTNDPTSRLTEVTAAVKQLVSSGHPLGPVAAERLEYSNNVKRAELMQLKDAFGFTESDVDESLHRAYQVSIGDLSGKWPLPVDEDPEPEPEPEEPAHDPEPEAPEEGEPEVPEEGEPDPTDEAEPEVTEK